ncbi:Asp-tRNA(Asn)/Glu-tRNA(Gln) amidotransferase subunit GatA [Haliangium sp. UPWRP_2]|uniref:Asp-tRNA(Asn)/Glu-tRNA(Gln) amidotransferase subunit GatA n=1 Tax=Haliangium sp. UPWRP_2 TaxID=1931276 RepID=UPI000B540989|nr:Asp-tRNA(Asn)/Glu-tRNA(Gln) amidotransferase subunit GatA [Haliangium sp. UPWRP_2]PSM32060.1 Asp-tRNA(Asn)/Glu-tRNA(Gln) amidotransferase subunit GatA [Haliangium sp. UPWRP_2]
MTTSSHPAASLLPALSELSGPASAGLAGLVAAVQGRQVSAREITQAYLSRIAALDPDLGCFLHVARAGSPAAQAAGLDDPLGDALAQAAAVDARIAAGEGASLPLAGVPVGLKDAICAAGLPTTAGSRILAGWVSPYDATVVARLRQAGAIIVGKLNMDEFAMGSSNENSAFFPCRNPWDRSRVPGGSSGGSAAAVAADLLPLALGSDTGGSIRQPAALCGVVGLKPTYGRVSRYGLIAFASSLDQIGPLARSVEDVGRALAVIGGPDPHDATSLAIAQPDYLKTLSAVSPASLRGLRIGLPQEYFAAGSSIDGQGGLDPRIAAAVQQALKQFQDQGAELVEVSLPHTPYAIAAYYFIATAEASSNLARYDGVRYGLREPAASPREAVRAGRSALADMYCRTRAAGFGAEVKRRILLGTYVLRSGYYDAYYRRASQVRTLIRRDFQAAFARCDLICTPTSPLLAFRMGERSDPLSMYLADIYTISCNLAGLPGLSLPCGFAAPTDGGPELPIGLQLLGPALAEDRLLVAGAAYQRLTDWHRRLPPLLPASAAGGGAV